MARYLLQESTDRWADVIDYERSPILSYSRAHWHHNGSLMPGLLHAQATKIRNQPPELLRLHRRVDRWLKTWTEKVNLWEWCRVRDDPDIARGDYGLVAWASPSALDWARSGGSFWPWTA